MLEYLPSLSIFVFCDDLILGHAFIIHNRMGGRDLSESKNAGIYELGKKKGIKREKDEDN